MGTVRSRDQFWLCNKMSHLAESVYKIQDSIVSVIVFGSSKDEVNRYRLPTLSKVIEVVGIPELNG